MILYWVALGLAALAGMGLQKTVIDRLWPAPVYRPQHHPAPAPPPPPARRQLEFEDTMDCIGAGYSAGLQARQWPPYSTHTIPRAELVHEEYLIPGPGAAELELEEWTALREAHEAGL
jgi:hypothetical protein